MFVRLCLAAPLALCCTIVKADTISRIELEVDSFDLKFERVPAKPAAGQPGKD